MPPKQQTGYPDTPPSSWTNRALRSYLEEHQISMEGAISKEQLVQLVEAAMATARARQENEEEKTSQPKKGKRTAAAPVTPEQRACRSVMEWTQVKLSAHLNTQRVEDIDYLRAHAGDLVPYCHNNNNNNNTEKRVVPLLESMLQTLILHRILNVNEFPIGFHTIQEIISGVDDGAFFFSAISSSQQGSSSVCGRSFHRSEMVYRCLQCAADSTCVFCGACFHASPCRNHEYRMSQTGGGMCDCGDPTAWKKESFCTAHRARDDSKKVDPIEGIPEAQRAWIVTVLHSAALQMFIMLRRLEEGNAPAECGLKQAVVEGLELFSTIAGHGECGCRLVLNALTQPMKLYLEPADNKVTQFSIPPPSDHNTTATLLDELVKFDTSKGEKSIAGWSSTASKLLRCVIVDPTSKFRVLRSLLKFFPLLPNTAAKSKRLMDETVQVITVPWAVEDGLNPEKLQMGAGNTILHMLLGALVALFVEKEVPNEYPQFPPHSPFSHNGVTPLMKLGEKESSIFSIFTTVSSLKHALDVCRLSGRFFIASEVLMRALCIMLQAFHVTEMIRRDENVSEMDFLIDISYHFIGVFSYLSSAMVTYMSALPANKTDTTTTTTNLLSQDIIATLQNCNFFSPFSSEALPVVPMNIQCQLERCRATLTSGMLPQDCRISFATTLIALVGQYLDESIVAVNSFIEADRRDAVLYRQLHKKTTSVADKEGKGPIADKEGKGPTAKYSLPPYNILGTDPFVFTIDLVRLVTFTLRSFLLAEAADTVASSNNTALSVFGSRAVQCSRLRSVCPLVIRDYRIGNQSQFGHVSLHDWVELLLNLYVVQGQHADQLWKRNFCGVEKRINIYQHVATTSVKEMDLLALQCFAAILGGHNLSAQMLYRFSYAPPPSRYDAKTAPKGYLHFLETVLIIVCDDCQSSGSKEKAMENRLSQALGIHPSMLRSSVQKYIGKSDDDDIRSGDAIKRLETRIDAALEVIATSTQEKKGTVLKMKKDTSVWSRVIPYNTHWNYDNRCQALYEYRLAVPLNKGVEHNAENEFPRPRVGRHMPALLDGLRLVLHSIASLSTAAYALINKAVFIRTGRSGGKKAQDCLEVPNSFLYTAIDTLLLAAEDAKAIAMEEQSTAEAAATLEAGDGLQQVHNNSNSYNNNNKARTNNVVDWSYFEQWHRRAQLLSATSEQETCFDSTSILPLPEYSSIEPFLHNLVSIPVTTCRFLSPKKDTFANMNNKITFSAPLSLLDSFPIIESFLAQGLATQSEAVLSGVYMSKLRRLKKIILNEPETEASKAAAETDNKPEDKAAKERASRIKERHQQLLEKMRQKQERASVSLQLANSSATAAAATATSEQSKDRPATVNLHEQLMVRATETECCFCRLSFEDEPLLWLMHAATSNNVELLKHERMGQVAWKYAEARRRKKEATAGAAAAAPTVKPPPRQTAGACQPPKRPRPEEGQPEGRDDNESSWSTVYDEESDESEEVNFVSDNIEETGVQAEEVEAHGTYENPRLDTTLTDRLNVSVMMCGHAAHLTCVMRHHEHLDTQRGMGAFELLRNQQGFRGMMYLGGAEFSCPVCSRISTALSCMPLLLDNTNETANSQQQQQTIVSVPGYLSEWVTCATARSPDALKGIIEALAEATSGFSRSADHKPIDEARCDARLKALGEGGATVLNLSWVVADNIRALLEGPLKLQGKELSVAQLLSLPSLITTLVAHFGTSHCSVTPEAIISLVQTVVEAQRGRFSESAAATPTTTTTTTVTNNCCPLQDVTELYCLTLLAMLAHAASTHKKSSREAKTSALEEALSTLLHSVTTASFVSSIVRCIKKSTHIEEEEQAVISNDNDIDTSTSSTAISIGRRKASALWTALAELSLCNLMVTGNYPSPSVVASTATEPPSPQDAYLLPINEDPQALLHKIIQLVCHLLPSCESVFCSFINNNIITDYDYITQVLEALEQHCNSILHDNNNSNSNDSNMGSKLVQKLIIDLLGSTTRAPPAYIGISGSSDVCVSGTVTARCSDLSFLPEHYTMFSQHVEHLKYRCEVGHGRVEGSIFLCLKCRGLLCLRRQAPELMAHVMRCGGGMCAFIQVSSSRLYVIEGVFERYTELNPIYVDRYGEADIGLRRGIGIRLSKKYVAQDFLLPYITNSWDHDSNALAAMRRSSKI